MIGDLHCHTRLSDGSMGLDDLIFFAKRAGLDFIAVTDHDTMDGVMRAAVLGKRYGIKVVPGVEISAWDMRRGRYVSLLCYLPGKPDRLQGILSRNLKSRQQAGREMIAKVQRYYPVTDDYIERYTAGSRAIYPSHILQALADLGYGTGKELCDELFEPEGYCRSIPQFYDIAKVAGLIRAAGGIAVLAQPNCDDSAELVEELAADELLHGVEVWHPGADGAASKALENTADRLGLLKTGGSNFHGSWSQNPCPIASRVTGREPLLELFAKEKQIARK